MAATGINSFQGLRRNVGNTAVRSAVDECMALRQQLTLKAELKELGGWNDPLNRWLAKELFRIRTTITLMSQDPAPAADQDARQAAAEARSKDEGATLESIYNTQNPITADDIQMPARNQRPLPYDFSGNDPNYPQLVDTSIYKNTFLRQFVYELDSICVELTNLACQSAGETIPNQQSAMILAKLDTAFTILQTKGGAANRREIADGSTVAERNAPDVVTGEIKVPGASN